MHKIAIIADPHYHEVFPAYRFEGVEFGGRAGACIRTLPDSAASTRIFNESYFAFPAALDACVAEGLRTIIIAGDLTDDGQIATMDAALALLECYEKEHGVRFFLTPGNHDVYGMSGRHHAKTFYTAGGDVLTVTSDPAHRGAEGMVYEPAMFCRDYAATAPLWAQYGVQRRAEDLHWECPFGTDDGFASRMFEMKSPDGLTTHNQLDLSYLVEPEPGLWVLSIDANVFAPRNGCPDNLDPEAFDDSTDAGWDALVRLKPFILDWMEDVSARAREHGKSLVCFSHYPALDTYDGTVADEGALFGVTQAVRRTPSATTGARVARTGVGTHFSGHLHVSDINTQVFDGDTLTNIALPSPVAFPPAFAIVKADRDGLEVTHRMIAFDRYDAFFPFYRRDAQTAGKGHNWTDAGSYREFLYGHVRELVLNRYLLLEWPEAFGNAMKTLSITDLFALANEPRPLPIDGFVGTASEDAPSAIDLVVDWYAARKGSALALEFITTERLGAYRELIALFRQREWDDQTCLQARLKVFIQMMARYLEIDDAMSEAAQ